MGRKVSVAKVNSLQLLLLLCLQSAHGGWIDPDTLHSSYNRSSYITGKVHRLVFSDEFNTPGRSFHDGSDPRWTAIHKDDYTNYALHYYNANLASTNANGMLNISTIVKDVSFKYNDVKSSSKPLLKKKNYQSAMLQGWNKFCFTGGIVEVSAQLPGQAFIGGLWPAMWMLGNLARATYVGSSNNIWPWSYDTCKHGPLQHQQRFSACNTATHFDFHPLQGRGAPEIDILEAMPGKEDLHRTSTKKPYYSASLQVAPGLQDYRPDAGNKPQPGKWYESGLKYGRNTSQNIFFYGMHLEGSTEDKSYIADAVSANRNIGPTQFEQQHLYRIEWVPGPQGYIVWYLDGEFIFRIDAAALNMTNAIIPEEPMYLLFNTAVSSTWGFPMPCPEGCACDCYDCRKQECACANPPNMCKNFEKGAASLLIDYVRVYQLESDKQQVVGCSTQSHPTKRFIQGNQDMYKSEGDKQPLLSVANGGGFCKSNSDCGAILQKGEIAVESSKRGSSSDSSSSSGSSVQISGECENSKCRCTSELYTGPHCRANAGFDDDVWDEDQPLLVSWPIPPASLLVFVAVAVLLLLSVAVWKYNHEKFMRSYQASVVDRNGISSGVSASRIGGLLQWMRVSSTTSAASTATPSTAVSVTTPLQQQAANGGGYVQMQVQGSNGSSSRAVGSTQYQSI